MSYKAPDIPASQVNPRLVRDELLKCFESANREFSRLLNQPIEESVLKEQVRQLVLEAFRECGSSFDEPTKEGIVRAIELCKKRAESIMGPSASEIIKHHYQEMMKLVEKL